MKAILSAPGSRGDVNPMIAIGRELRGRGHDVVISLAEPYAGVAADAGLEVEPVITRQRFDELLSSPSVWKPLRGARTILGKVAAEFLPLHYSVIEKHFREGDTILVSHPLDFASRIFREMKTVPLVDVHLAPCMLRTYDDPPRMTPWWFEFSRPSWLVEAAYAVADYAIIDPVIAKPVNQFRFQNLKGDYQPARRIIEDWWLSPDRIVAMYPDWFSPSTAQFTPRLVHCGFPLQDCAADSGISSFEKAGCAEPTVAFTAGTAHRHSKRFFTKAVSAIMEIGCRGLLLTTHRESVPDDLPPNVFAVGYTSFAELFLRCDAVVHHGGVGTTSQCLAAGVPQIIRPLAFDQFDHASKIEALGVGKWLRGSGLRSRDAKLASTIESVLNDPQMKQTAKVIADRLFGNSAIKFAADQIEATASEF